MSQDFKSRILQAQCELKAPKNQFNSYGNYSYRSCEDILESLKPILQKHNLLLTISDELVVVGDRLAVRATSTLSDVNSDESISTTAYALVDESGRGMSGAQQVGSSSSYCRKYCLNALFLIDDQKDDDTNEVHEIGVKSERKSRKSHRTEVESNPDELPSILANYDPSSNPFEEIENKPDSPVVEAVENKPKRVRKTRNIN